MKPLALIVVAAWVVAFWQAGINADHSAGKATSSVAVLGSLALGLWMLAT